MAGVLMSGNFKEGVVASPKFRSKLRKIAEKTTLLWWRDNLIDHVLPLNVPSEGGDVLYHLHLNSLVNCVPLILHGFSILVKFKSAKNIENAESAKNAKNVL